MSQGPRERKRDRATRALERLRERALERPDALEFDGYYADIAQQVTTQRLARELSQRELAELCGTTQSAIARLEAGERAPRVDTLLRIANALDCALEIELRPRTRTTKEGRGGDGS
jgi:ribosome-binding protein aMBF1 (putative translation factor)